MNIAGLDIASTTGLAFMTPDQKIETSTFRAEGKKRLLDRDDDRSLDAVRLGQAGRSFEDHLEAWLIANDIGYVAIEAPLNTNFQRKKRSIDTSAQWAGQAVREEVVGAPISTFFKIHMLEGIACALCARLNIPALFVNQATWRNSFLGTGRPGNSQQAKKAARDQCRRLGIACDSDDAAEAAGIVWHLNGVLNPYGKRANDLFAPVG